jgi:hypothetical protein
MLLDLKNQSDFTHLFSASSIEIEIYTFLMTTNQYWWNTNKHLGLKKKMKFFGGKHEMERTDSSFGEKNWFFYAARQQVFVVLLSAIIIPPIFLHLLIFIVHHHLTGGHLTKIHLIEIVFFQLIETFIISWPNFLRLFSWSKNSINCQNP